MRARLAKRHALAAVALAAVAVVVSGAVSVAAESSQTSTSAVDPGPESGVSERELERDRLLDPTFDQLAELPGFQDGGLHAEDDVIVVYWAGEVGPEAQAAIDASEARGVPVEVIPVPYSHQELRVFAGQVIEAAEREGIVLEGYRLGGPFEEIVVWGSVLDEDPRVQQTLETLASEVLPPELELVVEPSPGEWIAADSRHDDGGQPTVGNGFTVGSIAGTRYALVGSAGTIRDSGSACSPRPTA